MRATDFWDDAEAASRHLRRVQPRSSAASRTSPTLEARFGDLETTEELAREELSRRRGRRGAPRTSSSAASPPSSTSSQRGEELRFFSGRYDEGGAIVTIHPGAGGTESQDWAEMLHAHVPALVREPRLQGRGQRRAGGRRGRHQERHDHRRGRERLRAAGLREGRAPARAPEPVRLGQPAPHELRRRRRVSPLVSDDVDVEIDDDDLRIDTYRSSGAGGQHVNKTSSAMRITHLPTNIVVQCQNERSQICRTRPSPCACSSPLVELEERKRAEELARERGEVLDVNFGCQIRSYVLHPYQMVKDLRTDHEIGNAQSVLDGDLDRFVHAYLRVARRQRGSSSAHDRGRRPAARVARPARTTPGGRRPRRAARARRSHPARRAPRAAPADGRRRAGAACHPRRSRGGRLVAARHVGAGRTRRAPPSLRSSSTATVAGSHPVLRGDRPRLPLRGHRHLRRPTPGRTGAWAATRCAR